MKFTTNNSSGLKNKYLQPAFTLSEMLIVLIIIGILMVLAIPVYQRLVNQANYIEAKNNLTFLHTLEKTYFYTYSRYSADLTEIAFEQEKTVAEGGTAKYNLEVVEASQSGFLAKATAVVDFDGDGIFNVWQIDQDKNLKMLIDD